MPSPRCYSRRLLNPFHGTLQLVSIENGDAESSDGIHWVLYVNHEDILSHTGMFEIRYGSWSQQDGLKLSIVRGTAQNSLIEQVGEQLVNALEAHAANVPFAQQDRYECWMLDTDGQPLALVASEVEAAAIQVVQSPMWHPGKSAYDSFRSEWGDAAVLRQLINQRAGSRPVARWVDRRSTDRGADMYAPDGMTFPPLQISENWADDEQAKLVQDYLHWQAPWLLQLDSLDDNMRRQYESHAWKRQLLCAKQFHLFARLLDQQALKVVRVQARLMGADSNSESVIEAFIDTGDKESYSP